MASMLRVARLINDTVSSDKHVFVDKGAMARILDMIADRAHTTRSNTGAGATPVTTQKTGWIRSECSLDHC